MTAHDWNQREQQKRLRAARRAMMTAQHSVGGKPMPTTQWVTIYSQHDPHGAPVELSRA